MSVKIKLQFYLIFLACILLLFSIGFNDLSLGEFWFFLDGNSLVGVQSITEEISKYNKLGFYFYLLIIKLLNVNLFFLFGILNILTALTLFLLLDSK